MVMGNAPVTGDFPSQRLVTRSFDFFSSISAWKTAEQTIKAPVILDAITLIITSL